MEPNITINVDPTNPGQFFACCGLLEIAHRLTGQAQGWFRNEDREFCICADSSLEAIVQTILDATIQSLDEKDDKAPPLHFQASTFSMRLDWWNDTLAGGSVLKTWAGQQRVEVIYEKLRVNLRKVYEQGISPNILAISLCDDSIPFYLNSVTGTHSSSIDVGYSLNALNGNQMTRLTSTVMPATEVFAFIGLQRFRPSQVKRRFHYHTWRVPRTPLVAATLQHLSDEEVTAYAFELLYRTKYLKSFLTAQLQTN